MEATFLCHRAEQSPLSLSLYGSSCSGGRPRSEGGREASVPVLPISPHTTVSFPFPGFIQPVHGALWPDRAALLSLISRLEQRCQV